LRRLVLALLGVRPHQLAVGRLVDAHTALGEGGDELAGGVELAGS
jgi:hypothetical protein